VLVPHHDVISNSHAESGRDFSDSVSVDDNEGFVSGYGFSRIGKYQIMTGFSRASAPEGDPIGARSAARLEGVP
jgi:hypothetical protein